ncbi:hypothetical protein E4U30_006477 [Claviceps sp. LM220 group G6]|nr:hypothetical protein E4U30_006477 [Claviceps sp. LM220 group G6]
MASTTDEFLSPGAHPFDERHSLAEPKIASNEPAAGCWLLGAGGWRLDDCLGQRVGSIYIAVRTLGLRNICKVSAPRRPGNTRGYSQQHGFFGETRAASRGTPRGTGERELPRYFLSLINSTWTSWDYFHVPRSVVEHLVDMALTYPVMTSKIDDFMPRCHRPIPSKLLQRN